eukprot:1189878-Prorocentrum_minimum.AAC.8
MNTSSENSINANCINPSGSRFSLSREPYNTQRHQASQVGGPHAKQLSRAKREAAQRERVAQKNNAWVDNRREAVRRETKQRE